MAASVRLVRITALLIAFSTVPLLAQGSTHIEESRVREIIEFLASDELAGRDTPSEGQDKAGEFLAAGFEKAGLKPWRNGKQAVVMDPMTFLSRLAAQVPPPRFHMLSYYGVFAPAAPGRSEIVLGHGGGSRSEGRRCAVSQKAGLPGKERRKRVGVTRMVWAELIKRVFLEDVLACPCGGRRRVLSMVFDSDSIVRVLRHLGLPCLRPIRAPPRGAQGELGFWGVLRKLGRAE